MATITVRGQGRVDAQPDELLLVFRVMAVADDPAEAFAAVGERTAVLEAVLDEAGVAEADRTTGVISVDEHQDHEPRRAGRLRHRAVNSLTVRLDDAASVPALMSSAVERAEAYVQGPSWGIADPGPARLEACRLAAEDAERRARAYADALGLRLGTVKKVTERTSEAIPLAIRAPVYAPVHAPELAVAAVVEVTYRLEEA